MEPYSGYKGKISELEEIASEFKFERLTDDLKNNWEAAVKAYPGPDKPLFFLEDEFIDKLMETFSFLKEIEDKFREAAKTARENERIRIIAWLWYHTAYVTKDLSSIYAWPNLSKVMGELEGMIPLLVLLQGTKTCLRFSMKEICRRISGQQITAALKWYSENLKINIKKPAGKQKPCLLSDTSRGFVLYRQASV